MVGYLRAKVLLILKQADYVKSLAPTSHLAIVYSLYDKWRNSHNHWRLNTRYDILYAKWDCSVLSDDN